MNNPVNQWQLQNAKNKLGQLVKHAEKGIPQYITVHGKSTVVMISTQEYQRLKHPASKLSSALLMPILDSDDNLFERNKDTGWDVDF